MFDKMIHLIIDKHDCGIKWLGHGRSTVGLH